MVLWKFRNKSVFTLEIYYNKNNLLLLNIFCGVTQVKWSLEGLAPIMYDPNLMGTPIPMLQIPESVMAQITTDMSSGRESSKFTQDGKTFQQLVAILPLRDFQCAGSTDSEVVCFLSLFLWYYVSKFLIVSKHADCIWFKIITSFGIQVGWACPQCTNVFQQEQLLKNHQRLICQGCDSVFKLVQTHYQCRACNAKFGAQVGSLFISFYDSLKKIFETLKNQWWSYLLWLSFSNFRPNFEFTVIHWNIRLHVKYFSVEQLNLYSWYSSSIINSEISMDR